MKSMNDGSTNNTGTSTENDNSNHWLGFSLSPHMNMEVTSASKQHLLYNHQPSSAGPTSFYLSPSDHLDTPSICFGVGQASDFPPTLSSMPLKSDGSLCIMGGLSGSHSQAMVHDSSPKLENFFGGTATMATHEYESHQRETMALSLDSIYYPQNAESETKWMYSEIPCQVLYQSSPEGETKHAQLNPECDTSNPAAKHNWASATGLLYFDPQPISTHMIDEGRSNACGGSSAGAMGSGVGDLQSLSLSMSPGSQSSCVTASRQISPTRTDCLGVETTKKRDSGKVAQKQPAHRKSLDTFGQRTSQFRCVTRHRWTGRYEAHLWDNSCKKEGQTRKGRQVYLGGYDMEEKAARAYDQAALKYWGPSTHINFPVENYQEVLEIMKNMSRQEFVAHLRRKSSGFSRGASIYRGVTRHHQHGRWQARIGRVAGNKDLYLGTFGTQEEAAEAYDVAAIKFRGGNAVTNFDITRYDVERITTSNTLLAGELARRNKERHPAIEAIQHNLSDNSIQEHDQLENDASGEQWKMVLYQSHNLHQQNACVEVIGEKGSNVGNYRNNSSFTGSLQGLIGIMEHQSMNSPIVEETDKLGNYSNHSSLVSSLSCSREGSPDKTSASTIFATKPATTVSSWISSAQLRPNAAAPISMAQLPVFAAWSDHA